MPSISMIYPDGFIIAPIKIEYATVGVGLETTPSIPNSAILVNVSCDSPVALSYVFVKDEVTDEFGIHHVAINDGFMSVDEKAATKHTKETFALYDSLRNYVYFFYVKQMSRILRCSGQIFTYHDQTLKYTNMTIQMLDTYIGLMRSGSQ